MNEKTRPEGAGLGSSAVAADWLSVIDDPRVKGLIAYVGSVSRELEYERGYRQAEADMAASWRVAARRVQKTLKAPTFDELQRLRFGGRAPRRTMSSSAGPTS